jgi:NADH dehydrogenase
MILVAGGTGNLGSALVPRLCARGERVRVLSRDPARAEHLRHDLVEVMKGDVCDVASLRRAVAGVETVVAAAHGFGDDDTVSPATVDRQGNMNLVDAAKGAGASVVLMSGVQAAPDSSMELFRAKAAAEEYVRASGVPSTIVRATAFVETWAGIMGPPLRASGRTIVFGRGDNPINFVSVADVAALVERVIMDTTLRGETLEIGGPANLTFNAFAILVGESLGMPPNPRRVPRAILRVMGALVGPFKPSLARHARGAVVMDVEDMSFDDASVRVRFPEVPLTDARAALEAYFARG